MSLRKLPSGRWPARYRPDGSKHGRQVSKNFELKRDAEAWLSTAIDQREGRISRQTVGEWGKAWLRAREGSVRPSTYARDETYWRLHIEPRWGAVKLADIDHSAVQDWADGLTDDLAPATAGKAVGIFASSLDGAVRAGLLQVNRARGIRKPQVPTSELVVPSREAVAALGEAIGAEYRSMVLTMAYAGLRIGEAAALDWKHVDLDKRMLQVVATVVEVRGHVSVGPPKTARARRYVPLPKLVAEALLEHSDRGGFVWPSPEGEVLRPSNWRRRYFEPARGAAGLDINPHGLRHLAVSTWIEAGVNLGRVARWSGHSMVAMQDLYFELIPDFDEAAMAALDAHLGDK